MLPLPSAPAAQKQLEELAEKNHRLQDEVEKWRAYYAAQSAAPKNSPPPGPNNSSSLPTGTLTPDDISTATASATSPAAGAGTRPAATKPAKPRTHMVAAGETLAAIARKSGVSLTALQSVNPGVTAKKLRVGQTVNLP